MNWQKQLEALAERIARLIWRFPLLRAAFVPVICYFDKPEPPPAPDYRGAAIAQGAANVETARASAKLGNPSFANPLGGRNVTFNYGGDPDAVFVTDYLNPAGQSRWDQEQRIIGNLGGVAESGLGRVGQSMATPFSLGSATEIQDRAESALMDRLNPQLERDREALRTQLINTGFRIGTEGYDQAMQRADEQANDARRQAVISALQTRPQAVQEEAFLRNIPLNELNALRSGAQVSMPQFQAYQGQSIAPPPIMQGAMAQGQADQARYNAQAAQDSALTGGLFRLGGAAIGAPWFSKLPIF